MAQVVDTESAKEFMRQALGVIDVEELGRISQELEQKSALFVDRLSPESLPTLAEPEFNAVLGRIFSVRRKRKLIERELSFEDMRAWTQELLHGEGGVEARFMAFVAHLEPLPANTRHDIASELLHFSAPSKYWLWTRWMWDPKTKTGSLPLVTNSGFELSGDSPGDIYMKVGIGVTFVHEIGEVAGFKQIGRGVFATDVFLCCVYVIYAYTVLKMRMTQEFNKVMPGMPEFCRRLLGLYIREQEPTAATSH